MLQPQRIGEAGLALMGAVLAVWGFAAEWPWWLVGGFLVLAVVLTALAFVGRHDAPSPPPSVFVRGSASGSSFDNVLADGAHTFIDGPARNASFRNVVFRCRRRR